LSRRLRLSAVGLVACAAVVVVAAAGLHHTLTYYETPSEVIAHPPVAGQEFRLGGLVERGSVTRAGVTVRFVLTDGAHDLDIVTSTSPPTTFRAGQGAVVEGWLTRNGVFHASQVLVRHSNQYEPPSSR
jgi:cytochrome c-type biogenesis protein CcmE